MIAIHIAHTCHEGHSIYTVRIRMSVRHTMVCRVREWIREEGERGGEGVEIQGRRVEIVGCMSNYWASGNNLI